MHPVGRGLAGSHQPGKLPKTTGSTLQLVSGGLHHGLHAIFERVFVEVKVGRILELMVSTDDHHHAPYSTTRTAM